MSENLGFATQPLDTPGPWHTKLNQALNILDSVLTETLTIGSTSGTYEVPWADLTEDEGKALRMLCNGVLIGDLEVLLPEVPRLWVVSNDTTGAFDLSFSAFGDEIVIEQGKTFLLMTTADSLILVGANQFSIPDESITGTKIADETITGDKIADETITGDQLADGAIDRPELFGAGVLTEIQEAFIVKERYILPALENVATSSKDHGLSGQPNIILGSLWCTTNEHGYIAADGDRVSADQVSGLSFWTNATKIGWSIAAAGLTIIPKAGGAPIAITPGSWRIHVVVYR